MERKNGFYHSLETYRKVGGVSMTVKELKEHCKRQITFAKSANAKRAYTEHLVLLNLLEGNSIKDLINSKILEE